MSGTAPIPMEYLVAGYSEWKYGHSKSLTIVGSTSCWVSIISSSILIYIILKSERGMHTTYHRLLVGLSICDILLSLSQSDYNALLPRDVNYLAWNARGNAATCSAMGFLCMMGMVSGVYYICSINLFHLAKVRYNKSDAYIRSRIEPYLHGVPIFLGLVPSSVSLAMKNFNDDGGGTCISPVYEPPHCIGYEDGEVREGFEIPCSRGKDGLPIMKLVVDLVALLVPPVIVGISMSMIYVKVRSQERRQIRYGEGSLTRSNTATSGDRPSNNDGENQDHTTRRSSILKVMKKKFSRRVIPQSSTQMRYSRAVMHRAMAYSTAYFVTWIWYTIVVILTLAGVWSWKITTTNAGIAFLYFYSIFSVLQGFFNLLIFMQPQVVKEKQSSQESISWFRAFGRAFWSGINGS